MIFLCQISVIIYSLGLEVGFKLNLSRMYPTWSFKSKFYRTSRKNCPQIGQKMAEIFPLLDFTEKFGLWNPFYFSIYTISFCFAAKRDSTFEAPAKAASKDLPPDFKGIQTPTRIVCGSSSDVSWFWWELFIARNAITVQRNLRFFKQIVVFRTGKLYSFRNRRRMEL